MKFLALIKGKNTKCYEVLLEVISPVTYGSILITLQFH